MSNNTGDPFIATLHTVLLAPYLWDRLFSIITLMKSGHACLLHKGFCTVYLVAKDKNLVTLPHSTQSKHAFLWEIKEMSKTKKLPSRKKISFRIITSEIRSHIHHIIVGWGYC